MRLSLFVCLSIFLSFSKAFTFTVTVGIDETSGKQGLGFDPSSINPVAGDTITFTFQLPEYIKNPNVTQHSVTQSTFDNPCTPKPNGFDTGVQSTGSANSKTGPTYNLLVNDSQPLWFFSSANSDCNSEMVLSVNPAMSGQTAAAFKENAKSAPTHPASPSSNGNATSSVSTVLTPTTAASPNAATRISRIDTFTVSFTMLLMIIIELVHVQY